MSETFRFRAGTKPLLVSIPHGGTDLPEGLAERLTPEARLLPDTDWHVSKLYDFAPELGVGVLAATLSRYAIDLNRPPDDSPLYPGASNTGLCPTTTFAGTPVYLPERAPDRAEAERRLEAWWRPYHAKLRSEIEALQRRHGTVVLWDAHSIRSRLPRFFDGRLPDLNFGTADGAAADADLARRLVEVCGASTFSTVLNGRFKGGYITRNYGRPMAGCHAVQLEIAQETYMDEDPPFTFLAGRADRLRAVLRSLLDGAFEWAVGRASGQSPRRF